MPFGGFDDAMHAEEAARRLDHVQARLPRAGDDEGDSRERREARRIAPQQQHQADQHDQHDLERHHGACADADIDGSHGMQQHRERRDRERGRDAPQEVAHGSASAPGSASSAATTRIGYS